MSHDPYTYDIEVQRAESWMDRPYKVVFTTWLNEKRGDAMTLYLHPREARDLIRKLTSELGL